MPRFRIATAALLLLLIGPVSGLAAAEEAVRLDFVNADIEAVVKAVGEMTGRTFVVDSRVKGTVNVVSGKPIPRAMAYPMLQSALRAQGFVTVEGAGFVKIVPEADGKTNPTPVGPGPVAARGDQLMTQVFTLKNESAAQLVNVLRPLIPANNTIAAYPSTNSLIITDYADNLKRIARIIETIDQGGGTEPVLVPILYASAVDLAQTLNRLLTDVGSATATSASEPTQRVQIIADARTNSVLLRSENPMRLARAKGLIEQLDTPTSRTGNVHILYLKNAEAARVAQTLRAVMTGDSSGAAALAPASPMTALGSGTGSAAAGAGGAPGTAATASPFQPAAASGAISVGGATIQADSTNNALIINAPEAIYNNLRAVVEMLDVRRAQVFVEVLIVEITADRAAEFGIQWQALSGLSSSNTQAIGGTNFGTRGSGRNIIDTATSIGAAGPGLNLGIVRGQVFIPGIGTITNLGLLARALETDANANILSTPNLLTLDNEEAKVVIGQNVPFITGQYAQTGTQTTPTPFQTIERRDVGLTLRVKPQITEGGTVRLAIFQEVSSLQDLTITNASGPITNKRSLESNVLVDDGQIVVLGGLLQDSLSNGQDKVPLLGDVPGIGNLFRYETRKRSKTNLMVFLRPTVIRDATVARGLTNDRYDFVIGEQKKAAPEERMFWPDTSVPEPPPSLRPNKP
ncbi:MAG: type II secretion system secretin GspD [Betaproteobacteria bacterium]|nr:type II secretion system secretin GspD [Betaproteobacteria bacterium]